MARPRPLKIDRKRDQRHPLTRNPDAQLVNFAFVEQQLARALWFMIEAVAVAEFGDIGVDQPDLAVIHFGIAFGDRSLTEAQRLDLGAGAAACGKAPLAQLDRASDYESEGREFESLRVHFFFSPPL